MHSHSVRHEHVIFLLVFLDVVVEALSAGRHGPRSTQLATGDKYHPESKHSRAILAGKEAHPDAKLNPRYLWNKGVSNIMS